MITFLEGVEFEEEIDLSGREFRELENYRWVNNSVKIDDFYDKLPKWVRQLVQQCEMSDKEKNLLYPDYCEDLDIQAKECYACGIITKNQYERICARYYGC